MNRLVAVIGMPGTGKSEAVKFFEELGYAKVYFGAPTFEYLAKEGLAISEVNEKMAREKLRQLHGMSAMAKLSLPKVEQFIKNGNVVIESMYSWEEYLMVREKFPQLELLAIWTPFELRVERLRQRKERPLTREEIQSRDFAQIENLHTGGPIALADWLIINTGTRQELIDQLQRWSDGRKTDN